MLLKDYTIEIFNSKCQPGAEGVHCFAHLQRDVGEALPYLNAVLGGFTYIQSPPSVTFKAHGKLITVHGKKIAVNALKDEAEAKKIVDWMVREINDAWDNREAIEPRYEGAPRPNVVEILILLPKTNCRQCGEPTCLVFATRIAEGAKGMDRCPPVPEANRKQIEAYMAQFQLNF